MSTTPTLTIYLTGASSTGKSTLLSLLLPLLLNTLPHSSIPPTSSPFPLPTPPTDPTTTTLTLHPISQDDFFLPEPLLPPVLPPHTDPTTPGEKNWDYPECLDWPRFYSTLSHIKSTGTLPTDHISYEVTPPPLTISESTLTRLRESLTAKIAPVLPAFEKHGLRIILVDGFLLLPPPDYVPDSIPSPELRAQLKLPEDWHPAPVPPLKKVWDAVLFLQAPFQKIKKRRESREGYATVEGWWKDPEGYFERVVWPGYSRSHGWLYKGRGESVGGDGGLGELDEGVAREWGLRAAREEWEMERILEWAVEEVGGLLREKGEALKGEEGS